MTTDIIKASLGEARDEKRWGKKGIKRIKRKGEKRRRRSRSQTQHYHFFLKIANEFPVLICLRFSLKILASTKVHKLVEHYSWLARELGFEFVAGPSFLS